MECACAVDFLGPPLTATCGGGAYLLFMGLLDAFVRNRCEISDACGRVAARAAPALDYDFVVVGGGSGGAAAAGRLAAAAAGWRVLLVEAGGDEPPGSQVPSMVINFHGDPHMDWNYKTDPEPVACQGFPEKRCSWPRGKVLGGCSVINGMMYTRGTPKDFENWKKAGNDGWGYEDVLPVFKRQEDNKEIGTVVDARYHGTGGPMTTSRFRHQPEMAFDILDAAREMGYPVSNDLNGAQYEGFSVAQSNTRDGVRLSSSKAFVRPQRNNPNFHVMLNSTATKILLQETGGRKRASAVQFMYNNRLYTVRAKKEIILAAGAINSPQLLLLSGIGPREELHKVGIRQEHSLPGVGRNLQNHVAFYITYLMRNRRAVNDLDWATALEYVLNRRGPMSSTGMSQVTARLNSPYADPSGKHPDLQIFFAGYLANCASTGEVRAPEHPDKPDALRTLTASPVVLHPKSKGYIGLRSKNPLDPPVMVANYLTEPEDVRILIAGIRVIQRLVNSTVLARKYGLVLDKEDYGDCATKHQFDSDDFWACAVKYYTGPENHQASSCRMGPSSDPQAVVDSKLQVYGIEGLRIADASVMPILVSGNTHATIVMMAERAVDFIKQKWLNNTVGDRFDSSGGYDLNYAPNTHSYGQGYPNTNNRIINNTVQDRFGGASYVPTTNYYTPRPAASATQTTYKPHYFNQANFQHSQAFHDQRPYMPNPFKNNQQINQSGYNQNQNNRNYNQYNKSYDQGSRGYGQAGYEP